MYMYLFVYIWHHFIPMFLIQGQRRARSNKPTVSQLSLVKITGIKTLHDQMRVTTDILIQCSCIGCTYELKGREGEREGGREKERERDRQTETETERETERDRDRKTVTKEERGGGGGKR